MTFFAGFFSSQECIILKQCIILMQHNNTLCFSTHITTSDFLSPTAQIAAARASLSWII